MTAPLESPPSPADASPARERPLSDCAVSTTVRVTQVLAGKQAVRRLADQGLPLNSVAQVVLRRAGGAVVLRRNGVTVGVGGGLARKTLVEVLPIERTGERTEDAAP